MPVIVKVKGNQETSEYKAALRLKKIFEDEFQGRPAVGEILIISNATLFGQATKDVDIVVLGSLDKFNLKIKSKAVARNQQQEDIELEQKFHNVFINDFCFTIEIKEHPAERIQLDGITLKVDYKDKLVDVTNQSENQKYALKRFFEDRLGYSPYICNFIWLRNVSKESIQELLGNNPNISDKHNYLPTTFGLKWLFQLACVQRAPVNYRNRETGSLKPYASFNCFKSDNSLDFGKIEEVFDLFITIRQGIGDLTRKKVEHITRTILKEQLYAQAIGEKLVIISGRAGTGKTIKLLNIAWDLAVNRQNRCKILTYNNALVSDIRRTLALAEIPDGIDGYTVDISTMYSFFYEILVGFEIGTTKTSGGNIYIENYLQKYELLLEELYQYIDNDLIGMEELSQFMKTRNQQLAWDYILIDEGQDWKEIEKKLIFFIFGKENTVIADGIDQLVRSQRKCNWAQGLTKDIDFRITYEKRGLRQKTGLVSFISDIAKEFGIAWEIEPKEDLYGGRVIVKIGDYTKDLHKHELELCRQNGNNAYEMLFLVPPSLVKMARNGEDGQQFFSIKEFNKDDIHIWDGTKEDLRSSYPLEPDKHRLLQYDSCRGLEGWTVICLELDEFIRYKTETFEEETTDQLTLQTFDEKRIKFVDLWTLIPLTRAIDTLIITIKNPESRITQVLKDVYINNPDIIEWLE